MICKANVLGRHLIFVIDERLLLVIYTETSCRQIVCCVFVNVLFEQSFPIAVINIEQWARHDFCSEVCQESFNSINVSLQEYPNISTYYFFIYVLKIESILRKWCNTLTSLFVPTRCSIHVLYNSYTFNTTQTLQMLILVCQLK